MRNLLVLLLVGVTVYCAVDVLRSADEERFGVHRALWFVFVLFVPVVGPLVWLAVRWSRRRAAGSPAASAPRRPVAPDDDPEFLWRLDEDRRRTDRGGTDDPPGPSA